LTITGAFSSDITTGGPVDTAGTFFFLSDQNVGFLDGGVGDPNLTPTSVGGAITNLAQTNSPTSSTITNPSGYSDFYNSTGWNVLGVSVPTSPFFYISSTQIPSAVYSLTGGMQNGTFFGTPIAGLNNSNGFLTYANPTGTIPTSAGNTITLTWTGATNPVIEQLNSQLSPLNSVDPLGTVDLWFARTVILTTFDADDPFPNDVSFSTTVIPDEVPEPSTWIMFAAGVCLLFPLILRGMKRQVRQASA
jgi:hypothetical protein